MAILVVAGLITVSAARSQEKPAPPTSDAPTACLDRFDLIFFAPDHPVVIRFQVRIGNSGITAFRQINNVRFARDSSSRRLYTPASSNSLTLASVA